MTLFEFFSNIADRGMNLKPQVVHSPWMSFCEIELLGKGFLIVDADFVPEETEGLVVECQCGSYMVEVQAIDYGNDVRIARLRCSLSGSVPEIENLIGTTWTDTARTAICDLETLRAVWGDDIEFLDSFIRPHTQTADAFGIAIVKGESDVPIPFVSSGLGDGHYPVFALTDGGSRVGFEIEFISQDEPYRFVFE